MFGLGAEVERDPVGIGGVAGDHHQLRRTGEAVDSHLAGQLPLRLLHVAVAGARDHVDRWD